MKSDRKRMRQNMLLIAFGVTLYAILMNLGALKSNIDAIFGAIFPVVLGLGMALVLNVPTRGFEKLLDRMGKKHPLKPRVRDMLALLLTLIAVPLVIFLVMQFIVPQFISAVMSLISMLRNNSGRIAEIAQQVGLDPAVVTAKINELVAWINQNITSLAGTVASTAVGVFSSVADLILALILAIYLLAGKHRVKRQVRMVLSAFAPEQVTNECCRIGKMFISTFSVFLSRQCLEAVILGTLILIGMLIFGLPYALSLSCLTAVLALIPFIGAYMSFAVGVIMIVLIDPTKALIYAIWFLVAQQIEGNVIYPKIVGSSVGLPSYVTLAAVCIGGAVGGIPGMVLIIPVVAVLYTLLREIVSHRIQERKESAAAEQEHSA